MRKISAMYEWSGGTDYRHTCYECQNCIRTKRGSRTIYKCLSYGNTEEPATDWNEANIACRAFGKKSPKIPVYLAAQGNESNGQIEGQMSLSDFITI